MRVRLSAVGWLRKIGLRMGGWNGNRKTEIGCNKPRKRLLQLPEGECVFLSASGARVVLRGGNANNGANDGAFYVNVNNELTNANTNIGGRLAEWLNIKAHFPHHHGELSVLIQALVGLPERAKRNYAR